MSNRSFLFCEEHPAPAKVERIQEEIRHYRFPPLAVRCEKELLEAEDAEEMRELLFRALSSLETFADRSVTYRNASPASNNVMQMYG